MKRIIATGFGPWGPRASNASWEALQLANPALPDGWELHRVWLPVSWSRGPAILSEAARTKPTALIAFGQCSDPFIRLERWAHAANHPEAIDVDGATSGADPSDRGDEPLASRLPLDRIERALQDAGIAAQPSDSAGDFLCNRVFYELIRLAEILPLDGSVGFIHVPAAERGELRTTARAIEIALSVTAASAKNG